MTLASPSAATGKTLVEPGPRRDRTVQYVHATDGYCLEPRPGLGYMLVALSEAFAYAYLTGRTLVIDWRDSVYSKSGRNLFTDLFEPVGSFLGVPVVYDRIDERLNGLSVFSIDRAYYESNIGTWRDNDYRVWSERWSRAAGERRGGGLPLVYERFEAFPLRSVGEDVIAAPYIGAVLSDMGLRDLCDVFLAELRVKEPFATELRRFRDEHFNGHAVMGLHVRHGNGERGDFVEKRRVIADLDRYLRAAAKAAGGVKRTLGLPSIRTFLCTDSDLVVERARPLIPDLVTRAQWRPTVGTGGSIHLGAACPDGEVTNAANALIDMYLLASSDYLAYPVSELPVSWFIRLPSRLRKHRNEALFYPGRWGRAPHLANRAIGTVRHFCKQFGLPVSQST